MADLLLSVEMVNSLYILPWHGGTDHLVLHWNLFGPLKANMLSGKVHQRLRSSVKPFWSVFAEYT